MEFKTPAAGRTRAMSMAAVFLTVVSTFGVSAQPYTPSPADWADEVIYQVLTDRFFDGDPSNNSTGTQFAPTNGARSHGGDWDGIRQKIPYLKALGATALWISPHVLNVNGAYHGYHARDFQAYAPNFGGQAAFERMRNDLKTSGIRLVLDVVPNHGGDLINNNPFLPPPSTYNLSWRNPSVRHAPPFDSLDVWHAHGTIGNYSGIENIVGELANLDDLKTGRPDVRTTITQIFKDWIARTDADAFRIDTVKHIELDFWQYWGPEIRAHAASLGKANFFQFGEVWDGFNPTVGQYTGTKAGGPFALDSVIDYPLYYRTNDVFARQSAGARGIMDNYGWQVFDYDPAALGRLVTNLDNHDNPRFLHSSLANGRRGRLRAALAFQMLSPGVPSVYYGTEQFFDGGNDPANREDMFDGQYEQGPSLGDRFDMAGDGFVWMRRLAELRRHYVALRRGSIVERQAMSTPGPFAFSRIAAGHPEVVVAINTSDNAATGGNWATNYAQGTVLTDALDTAFSVTVGAGGVVSGVPLAGNGTRVLAPASTHPDWDPTVVAANVPHDSRPASMATPLILTLSEPINPATLDGAVQTTPTQANLSVAYNATTREVSLAPGAGGWQPAGNGILRFGLLESITDLAGRPLRGGFELLWNFNNAPSSPIPLTDPTVDGTIIGDPRYAAGELLVQTVQTQFGNNTNSAPDGNSGGSELNNLHLFETTQTLYLGFGGNLEYNGNGVAILFDLDGSAGTGTTNLSAGSATSEWLAGSQGASNTQMPAGFGCDIAIFVSAHSGSSLRGWVYRWAANGQFLDETDLGVIARATLGQATKGVFEAVIGGNVVQISAGLDNRHTGPVAAGTGAASPTGSGAATGLELALPRALFGGDQNRRFFAAITGSAGFWSNQFLPPVTAGANLGWKPNLAVRMTGVFSAPAIPVRLSGFALE